MVKLGWGWTAGGLDGPPKHPSLVCVPCLNGQRSPHATAEEGGWGGGWGTQYDVIENSDWQYLQNLSRPTCLQLLVPPFPFPGRCRCMCTHITHLPLQPAYVH